MIKLRLLAGLVAAALLVAGAVTVGTRGGATTRVDPRATIFIQRGCAECHAIAALGVRAQNDVGPDLTFAYADVVNRYGVSLESFLGDPAGVMRLMLASHLHLTSADRDSILHVLTAVYEAHRAEMDSLIPSSPPTTPRPRARPKR
jgi:hypothetical protein